MVERYNKTLLNMLGTLSGDQKTDGKSYVSTLTHAYNAAEHESTEYAPFFLMFGRHPRIAIDAFLGLKQDEDIPRSHQDYVDKLKQRLDYSYNRASEEAKRSAEKQKKYYDRRVKYLRLEPGDSSSQQKCRPEGKTEVGRYLGQASNQFQTFQCMRCNRRTKSKLQTSKDFLQILSPTL